LSLKDTRNVLKQIHVNRIIKMATSTSAQALVYRALPEASVTRIAGLVVLAIAGSLLLTISGQIKVPFYPVPATLQTLAVFMIAAAYGRNLAVATVALYLAQGAAGLPVFTGGAGLAYMAGPTGGFLAGFLVAAAVIGSAVDRGWGANAFKLFGATLLGAVLLMGLGYLWLSGLIGAEKAWTFGVAPFALGELTKVVLASALIPAVAAIFRRK
jgi:biotin transport system substrate-specific component